MITCEQDPDVIRWGLHHLDCCSLSNSGSLPAVTQYGADVDSSSSVQSVRQGFVSNIADVENDEIIAHALQEEISHIAALEKVPAVDDLSLETMPTDGRELGKRLNRMVPIPHVPKINGEIPSLDEATSDHQILLDRLKLYDLVEHKVHGDGNCQFRALSDQFYHTSDHHRFVRQQIVDQLKSHPEVYEGYVPMPYDDYLNKMTKNGEWGDHVTLQAASDSYGLKIFVLTSFKDTCYIEILPHTQKSTRVICLSFWAEVHYNSIYPADDPPTIEDRKKKKWWVF